MAGENKVFDVAMPGSSKPETGSKPMVVGHKNLLDPTLKGSVESESTSTDPLPTRTEKTLAPMSETTYTPEKVKEKPEDKEVVIASDEKIELDPTPPEIVTSRDESAPESDDTAAATQDAPEETPEQRQKAEDDLEIEREEKLQEMIKNKIYYAPIKEASLSSVKTFIKTFTIVAVLGVIILVVLIDAEILDLGVKLPFNFLQ